MRRARAPDSPETRRLKSLVAKAAAEEKQARKRWYITINVRPAETYINRWGQLAYRRMVWPILFKSEKEAWDYAKTHPQIWNPPPGKRKVVSYAISSTYLPKHEIKGKTADQVTMDWLKATISAD